MDSILEAVRNFFDIESVVKIFFLCTIPGAFGGVLAFIWANYKGHYKNNKYVVKFFLEAFGGLLVASFIGQMVIYNFDGSESASLFFSFTLGVFWATVVQALRGFITRHVEGLINSSNVK